MIFDYIIIFNNWFILEFDGKTKDSYIFPLYETWHTLVSD